MSSIQEWKTYWCRYIISASKAERSWQIVIADATWCPKSAEGKSAYPRFWTIESTRRSAYTGVDRTRRTDRRFGDQCWCRSGSQTTCGSNAGPRRITSKKSRLTYRRFSHTRTKLGYPYICGLEELRQDSLPGRKGRKGTQSQIPWDEKLSDCPADKLYLCPNLGNSVREDVCSSWHE